VATLAAPVPAGTASELASPVETVRTATLRSGLPADRRERLVRPDRLVVVDGVAAAGLAAAVEDAVRITERARAVCPD
jgi:hypothetical protein